MFDAPPPDATRPRLTAALLVAFAVLIVLGRFRTAAEPPERDVAGYAVIGHEMARGRVLYADLWERKPPLLYVTFAAAERAVGYGANENLLVNVAAALATLAGCYAAGRAWAGPVAGLCAAGLWTVLGGDALTAANQPNAEAFVNAALTAAVAVLLRPGDSWHRGLIVGAAFTVATLYEQHVALTCGTIAIGAIATNRRRLPVLVTAAAVGVVAWAALAGYFAAVGRLGVAARVLFGQPLDGVHPLSNLLVGLRPEHLAPSLMAWAAGPAALVLLAAVVARPPTARRRWPLWLGWAVGTWVTVCLPGRFFPHYYQLWIPPLCLAGGVAAGRLLGPTRRPTVAVAAVVATFVALLGRELPPYLLWSPAVWAGRQYPTENFAEQAYLADRLNAVLRPDERFWVLGQDNTLYFLTRRSPPSGQLFLEPLLPSPDPRPWRRMADDLARASPPLVVVRFPWDHVLPPPAEPVLRWLHANYDRAGTDLTARSYDLWVRRGDDDLLNRLRHPPPAPPYRSPE